MVSVRFVIFLIVIAVAFAAKKPKRNRKPQFVGEILSKNQTSVRARFKQYRRVKKYFISIQVKGLMDVSAHYVTTIKKKDRKADNYYYIDAINALEPGNLYEITIANKRKYTNVGSLDFFTDCDDYSYQCETEWGQTCLSASDLCSGHAYCKDGSDDETNEDGSCVVTVPERPTPPPPPADAPCILARTAAQAASESNLPDCDIAGNYATMRCGGEESFSCHCQHPLTGAILVSQPNYSPFEHWDFADNCEKRRTAALAQDKATE